MYVPKCIRNFEENVDLKFIQIGAEILTRY